MYKRQSLLNAAALGVAGIYVTILFTDQIIAGSMSPGDFAVIMGVFYGISWPAAYFGAIWIKLQEAVAAVRRVFFFVDYDVSEDCGGERRLTDVSSGIRFDRVGFNYPDGHTALRDISLS